MIKKVKKLIIIYNLLIIYNDLNKNKYFEMLYPL